MELPVEKNDTSEQSAEIVVPLDYRLAHLNIDPSAVYPKLTATSIARILDLDSVQVNREIRKHEIDGEIQYEEQNGGQYNFYPQYTVELIREERRWAEWYRSLPIRMHTSQIAEAVGRSYGWTAKTLAELYPDVKQRRNGHRSRFYPKTAVKSLRERTLATTPDESWHTIPRLMDETGRNRDWVVNRLAMTPLKPEMRRHPVSGRDYPYYPPESLETLQEIAESSAKAGGEWLTASAIKVLLNSSRAWVGSRLERFVEYAEPRLDDMGVERVHYPPEVVSVLRQELEDKSSYERSGDWVTISKLRVQLGMSAVTVLRMMEGMEIEEEERLDGKNRLKPHYSPETQTLLAAKALAEYKQYPKANGWMTLSAAQRYILRPRPWIADQLIRMGIEPVTRIDTGGRPADHYSPETIEQIKVLGDSLDPGDMVSLSEIVERVGRSMTWVTSRLKDMNIKSEKRFSRGSNSLRDHYPSAIIQRLIEMQ